MTFYDVLAVLQPTYGEHGFGRGIFGFLSTREARPLRLVSKILCADVKNARWYDRNTVITGDLRAWRACFSDARCANVSKRRDLTDADLVHLSGGGGKSERVHADHGRGTCPPPRRPRAKPEQL